MSDSTIRLKIKTFEPRNLLKPPLYNKNTVGFRNKSSIDQQLFKFSIFLGFKIFLIVGFEVCFQSLALIFQLKVILLLFSMICQVFVLGNLFQKIF